MAVVNVEGTAGPTFDDDYVMNTFKILSDQHNKEANIKQVPFKLGIPGPASLRKRSTGYRVILGDKKVD